jgi:hypothetical protein
MNLQVPKTSKKRFLSTTFSKLVQVEKAITFLKEQNTMNVQLTLLIKLDAYSRADLQKAEKKNGQLKAYLKKWLGPKTDFGIFHNPQIGTVFIGGPLSELFLHDIDGKKLAELSEGPYGILRGLGIYETQATSNVKKLNEGQYLLLFQNQSYNLSGLEAILEGLETTV